MWEYLSAILGLIRDVAVTAASIAAVFGISEWRRKHVGTRRIDVAEEIRIAFFDARRAWKQITNPFMFSSRNSVGGTGGTTDACENEIALAEERGRVVYERYLERMHVFDRLEELQSKFEAIFTGSEAEPFKKIRRALNALCSTAQLTLAQAASKCRRKGGSKEYLQYIREDDLILRGKAPSETQEAGNDTIEAAIKEINETLEPLAE